MSMQTCEQDVDHEIRISSEKVMVTDNSPYYMRSLSSMIRRINPKFLCNSNFVMKEDSILEFKNVSTTLLLSCLMRRKARLLSDAWSLWNLKSVSHDYKSDLKMILKRPLGIDELRTELEIEVLYKWMVQNAEGDPTNIAHLLGNLRILFIIFVAI